MPLDTPNRPWRELPGALLPLAYAKIDTARAWLLQLRSQLDQHGSWQRLSAESSKAFRQQTDLPYRLVLLGRGAEELRREIDFCLCGMEQALTRGEDWRTPTGSLAVCRPLGREGTVAFVYPGIGSFYPGFSRDWPVLFPSIFQQISQILGPREDQHVRDCLDSTRLNEDIGGLCLAGSVLAYAGTAILRSVFGLCPASAFGYSLGETTMFGSLGVWQQPQEALVRLSRSPILRSRLAGPMEAIREAWGLLSQPGREGIPGWGAQILSVPPDDPKLLALLSRESKLFLTHINTPGEIVLAGDPPALERAVRQLKVQALPVGVPLAIHCPLIASEQETLLELFDLPVGPRQEMVFYSAAYHTPVPQQARAIARALSAGLCQRVDFPRLVETVYSAGARIFVEVGPRRVCSSWIDTILAGRPHVTVPIDQKAVETRTTLLQALARLLAHQVDFASELLLAEAGLVDPPFPSETVEITFDSEEPEPVAQEAAPVWNSALKTDLERLPTSPQRRQRLLAEFQAELARMLGLHPQMIDAQVPLPRLGVDSFTAMQLRLLIDRDLQVLLPIEFLLNNPTLEQVAEETARQLEINHPSSAP